MKEFIDKLIGRLEECLKTNISARDGYGYLFLQDSQQKRRLREANEYHGVKVDAFSEAISIVNQLAEEYKGGWIPCSERLPKEATYYLVTEEVVINSKKQYVIDIRLFGTEQEWLCPTKRKIIAWQPLPQPYKEGE